jgi:hypothetical protein
MMNFVKDWVKCPPRKTRVNMPSHIQVHTTTAAKVARPIPRRAGFAAKILEANSKMPIALFKE